MITTLCLNPAMDRTVVVDDIELGHVLRSQLTFTHAGGKGMNVARAVRRLGEPSRIMGFAGGFVGDYIHRECQRHGIDDRLTSIDGESRVCYILVEDARQRSTVINEPGPEVSDEEIRRLWTELEACIATDTTCFVISGSSPPGVQPQLYARAVELGRRHGIPVILDANGPALVAGVRAGPWMIKPNADELRAIFGELNGADDHSVFLDLGSRLLEQGANNVVVSLGAGGCLLLDATDRWWLKPPAVVARNAVGSGDAFVAGVAVGIESGMSVLDSVRLGSACGALNAGSVTPDLPRELAIEELMSGVSVTSIS